MATVTILLSNIIDSFTSLPQFVQIVWYREIENVSSVLVAQFLAGDIMKLCMYILGHAAWPFKFGASLQTCLDTILLISYVRQKCFAQPTNQQSRRNSMQEEILPK